MCELHSLGLLNGLPEDYKLHNPIDERCDEITQTTAAATLPCQFM